MKCLKQMMIPTVVALAATTASASNDIQIDHLGTNNTFVRVQGADAKLLLPIQESVDDARIDVVVDGHTVTTFYARLAKSNIDFEVPFDLAPYKGRNVVLNITSAHDRSSVREIKDDACWSEMRLTTDFDVSNREKFRPAYHHSPLYGWMNDPNGMVYRDGIWHLYYQYNPYGSKWQNMSWGHSTSTDLINWKHQPVAIEPNGFGTIFSGSAVLDPDNTAGFGSDAIVAMYTSAAGSQTQSLAYSNDGGQTFSLYPGSPVITRQTEARDPKVFFNQATGEWNLVLAHALDHEVLVYASKDLKSWEQRSAFGKVAAQDGVWECPDLFELTLPDGTSKWVMIVNLNPGGPFGGSGVQYFTGDFDGNTFTPDTMADGTVPTKWLDFGKDNYALVTWYNAPDNRRTGIGWMSNWQYAAEVPTRQFRSANTLPRDLSLFKSPDGNVYVASNPSPELDALREKPSRRVKSASIGTKASGYALPTANDGICEIDLTIVPRNASKVELALKNSDGQHVDMVYDCKEHTFTMDRTQSGIVDFSRDFLSETTAPTFNTDGSVSLRLFIDRSSIEIFGNDGRFSMTNLVFPDSPYSTLELKSEGGKAELRNLTIYPLKAN